MTEVTDPKLVEALARLMFPTVAEVSDFNDVGVGSFDDPGEVYVREKSFELARLAIATVFNALARPSAEAKSMGAASSGVLVDQAHEAYTIMLAQARKEALEP